MVRDSMEFLEIYRCRLKDAGICDGTDLRGAFPAIRTMRRPPRPAAPALRGRCGVATTRLLGRLLTDAGRLLATFGERLSAAGAAHGASFHG
jgi:hypothetical protein